MKRVFGMEPEKTVAVLALCWLITSVILLARSIRRGRALAIELATRYPETYDALGRPQPGFFQSARRSRFAQFIMRREYETLGDSDLCARFEDYRSAELRLLVVVLVSMIVVALLVLSAHYVSSQTAGAAG